MLVSRCYGGSWLEGSLDCFMFFNKKQGHQVRGGMGEILGVRGESSSHEVVVIKN